MTTTKKTQVHSTYPHVHFKDCYGTLHVSDSGIRFRSDEDNNILEGDFILSREELVNVSTSCFAVQKLFLVNVAVFKEGDSSLISFQMANALDMVKAKDKIESILHNLAFMPCNVSEKLAEHQEAAFYAF